MEQNKTGKYLKYAIGEIILVVIGILIALSINNWNIEQEERQLETELLTQLKTDLLLNKKLLKELSARSSLQVNSASKVINALRNKLPLTDSLLPHFSNIYKSFYYQLNATSFENLKTLGFNIISNKELRVGVQTFYGVTLDANRNFVSLSNQKYLISFFPLIKERFHIFPSNIGTTYIPINYQLLINDLAFINALQHLTNSHKFFAENNSNQVSTIIDELINDINKELSND